jgi:opacity protein-like surface antigen
MKNYGKTMLIIMFILTCTANSVFSQIINLVDVQTKTDILANSLSKSLPFNSTIGNNWSDAYIGQITERPYHFGFGVSAGATTVDFNVVRDMLKCFDLRLPFNNVDNLNNYGLPLPNYTVDVRFGGFNYPFDFGLKAEYLPQKLMGNIIEDFNFLFKQILFGMDIRYSFINNKLIPIKFSFGMGINFLDGGIIADLPKGVEYSLNNSTTNYILTPTEEAQAGIEWRTLNGELKAQFSFPFKFLTPYAGAGISYAWTQAGYKVTTPELQIDNRKLTSDEEKQMRDRLEITGISEKGFETMISYRGISARVFGGASINLAYFRIDMTAMYEFINGNLGATIGLRFQQ